MMKRLLAIVCLLIMVSISTRAEWELPVFDEVFSIRNGISFGMNEAKIREIEEKREREQGNTVVQSCDLYTFSVAYNAAGYNGMTSLIDEKEFRKRTSASGQDVLVIYTFDNAAKMDCMRYLRNSALSVWPLTDSLVSKYGSPIFVGGLTPFESKALNYYRLIDTYKKGADLIDHIGWLVEYQDMYVLIEAVQFFGDTDGYYYENITYTPISSELYNLYQHNQIQEQQSIANDM